MLSTSLLEIISILFCCIILSVVSVNCSFKLCSLTFISIFSTLRSDKLTIELEILPSTPAKVFKIFFLYQKSFIFLFHVVFHLEQYLVFFFALPHIIYNIFLNFFVFRFKIVYWIKTKSLIFLINKLIGFIH